MDDRDSKVKLDESSVEQDAPPVEQNKNILEEIRNLNEKIRDPKYQTFQKSTYWHQQTTTMEDVNQEALLKEMIECLLRIEAKLTQIETLLEK